MEDAMTPDNRTEVLDAVVVGAGISGLASAFGLRRGGLRVQVLDTPARPGGVIGTVARRLPVRARPQQCARHHAADR